METLWVRQGWKLVARGNNPKVKKLELFVSSPDLWVRGEWLKIEFSHQWPVIELVVPV